ncbi:VTT domain-containing protein [Bacillus sp. B15-48]|uniref:TVP38/TMEM64 family protein n=1 Tax=Bacillus sp. B15-48 TaxID=1548601 RepID=UPI00193F3486|nr:VTT domain-containing protein [Bacillus sp. B15-48]MBM4760848.1 TVP38/TMEM64 family protein [Bacillus sp. B15-48]
MERNLKPEKRSRIRRKTVFIWLLFVTIVLFFTFNRELFKLILDGDIDAVREKMTGKSFYAYTFMLLIMIVQNSFTIVPLILVITVNIALFGVINGFLWSWFTSVVAGGVVFLAVRYFFQEWLTQRFDEKTLAKIEDKGFVYVFQGRVFPFVPTSLINILAGVSTVQFRHFIFATAIGNFLYFLLLSLIPAGLMSPNINEYELGLLLFLTVTILFILKRFYDKKKKKQVDHPIDAGTGRQLDD